MRDLFSDDEKDTFDYDSIRKIRRRLAKAAGTLPVAELSRLAEECDAGLSSRTRLLYGAHELVVSADFENFWQENATALMRELSKYPNYWRFLPVWSALRDGISGLLAVRLPGMSRLSLDDFHKLTAPFSGSQVRFPEK